MAGIAAAAALRGVYDEVVVLERDTLSPSPVPRRGVPQSEQLHNLLGCAQVHLECLLPGFCDALLAAGGRAARVAEQTHVYELGTRMPERDVGLRLMCAWRPVIETVARELLLTDDGGTGFVTILEGTSAVALQLSSSGAVNGVTAELAGQVSVLPADLVVDASGASSKAPHWLSVVGADVPGTSVARPGQWYVTTQFEGGDADDGSFWLTFPTPPASRGGLVSPADRARWCVSLSGRTADPPPSTVEEVRAFASTLEDPAIAMLLEGATAVSEPRLFRKITASWRRYDLLARPLPGFFPIGDAIASLNPLFGQGMSVAAWQASELADVVAEVDDVAEATARYLARASAAVVAAWSLGELVDAALGGTERRRAVSALVHDDPEFHAMYVRIWHLLEPAAVLDRPDIRAKIDRASRLVARAC
jgi:2-polyprenyl-6-methoxyphenol hydroxylase-like FAD-dependent oxidoreductase